MATTVTLPASQHSSYLQYKKNTSTLIRWIVTTASSCAPSFAPPKPKNNNPKHKKKAAQAARHAQANAFSPEITTTGLVLLSQAIAEAKQEVPPFIFTLFDEVIRARTAAYEFWSGLCVSHPDRENIQKSNEGHLAFIDALNSAFGALGGALWRKRHQDEQEARQKAREADRTKAVAKARSAALPMGITESLDFENKFAGLEFHVTSSEGEAELEELAKQAASLAQNATILEGDAAPKGKDGNVKSKGKRQSVPVQPLDHYKIKSDTESYFAVCFFLRDFLKLSRYIRDIWRQVGLGQLHCAVAGALSNVATGMIRSLQYDITMDFPGCDHFRGIIKHLIRDGNSDLIGNNTSGKGSSKSKELIASQRGGMDLVEEQLLINTESDLFSFIDDYRKNRSGKPTSTFADINWNPNFSGRKMARSDVTPQKVRKWKSDYTISWLYDLVNTYAVARLQKDQPREKRPETLDWKFEDPFDCKWTRRTLWGRLDFAYDITVMCMQKPGGDITSHIKPHHVFQLQIALDSMITAKRWNSQNVPPIECYGSTSSTLAWELESNDLRAAQRMRDRWMNSTTVLLKELEEDRDKRKDPGLWSHPLLYLPRLMEDTYSLGETVLVEDEDVLPASLFAKSTANGLWLYSPYLCGTGMVEMFNTAYDWGTKCWHHSGFMVGFFHLYNVLLENGHLKKPIDFFERVIEVFKEDIFGSHRPRLNDRPVDNYHFINSLARAFGVKAEYLGSTRGMRRGKGGTHSTNKESMFRSRGKPMYHGKFIGASKLFALNQAGWMASRIDSKKFPSLATPPREAIGFLEAIRADLADDVAGETPVAYLNYHAILTVTMIFLQALEDCTADIPMAKFHMAQMEKEHGKLDFSADFGLPDKVLSLALYPDPVMIQDMQGKRLNSPILARMGEELDKLWEHGPEYGSTFFYGDGPDHPLEKKATTGRQKLRTVADTVAGKALLDDKLQDLLKNISPEAYETIKHEMQNTVVGDCANCAHCQAGVPIGKDDTQCAQM